VSSPGHSAETTVDAKGHFEFSDLPEGEYSVSVNFGNEWEAPPELAKIFNGSCVELDFRPKPSASVSGRLVPRNGTLPRRGYVSLFPATTTKEDIILDSKWVPADPESGVFELTGLEPGRYYLGLNVEHSPNIDSPYPKTYFPGVQDRAQSTMIEVKPGVKLMNIDIALPDQLIEHDIEVQVLWSDGRTARGGYAYLRSQDHPGAIVAPNGVSPLDGEARVVLKGFQGYVYDVIGTIACLPGGPNGRDSKPLRVPETPERPSLKVVLEGPHCEHYPNGR
jgi:hypothetical protein